MFKRGFREKVVIITGASRGLGRELALQFAKQGAWLSLASRNVGQLESVAAECLGLGTRVLIVPTDVSDKSQCQNLIDKTLRQFYQIDVLINNASTSIRTHFEDIQDVSLLEEMMQVNYFGSMYCTHYALPSLKRNKGRIISISRKTSLTGVPHHSGEAASINAVTAFFDALRIELASYKVSVTMAYPEVIPPVMYSSPERNSKAITVYDDLSALNAEAYAKTISDAATKRRGTAVMSKRGTVGRWIKSFSPGMGNRIVHRPRTIGF